MQWIDLGQFIENRLLVFFYIIKNHTHVRKVGDTSEFIYHNDFFFKKKKSKTPADIIFKFLI